MSLLLNDPDRWYEVYESASAKQQYDMLLEAISQPLTEELVDRVDLGGLLVDLHTCLESNNSIEQAIALVRQVQQNQPELYRQEFPYLDDLLVEYYLFRREFHQARSDLERYMANPVKGVDQMFKVLDFLKYYDAKELAVELCRTTYSCVASSPEIIRGAEVDLGETNLMSLIEQAYQQLQQGETVDWQKFEATASQYGFEGGQTWMDEICLHLTTELIVDKAFLAAFQKKQPEVFRHLSMDFYKYMADRKQVGFICSHAIWGSIFEFLSDRKQSVKQLSPDNFFTFSPSNLDAHVAGKLGGFFSMQQAEGFGILWGIPYVYDFLLSIQFIKPETQARAIAAVNTLKPQVIQAFQQHLWKYDFVHRWLPPDSISETDFTAEAELFASSIEQTQSLEELNAGGVGSFFSQLTDTSARMPDASTDRSMPQQTRQANEPNIDDAFNFKYKEPKKKKSPLQLAAEMGDRRPPKEKKLGKPKKKK